MSTFRSRKFKYLILIALFFTAVLVWQAVFERAPDSILEVHFFDVGQGDSIFIECPNGRQILIDGGPDNTILERLGEVMSLYDRSIDLVILTHPDADHITGLVEVLERYEVSHILTSGFKADSAAYYEWKRIIEEKNISLTLAQARQVIFLQPEISMDIFWPDAGIDVSVQKANNISIVGRLVYGQSEFLLTGDIEKKIEKHLLGQNYNLDADILKIAHHGSKTSSIEDFIAAVSPQISVISVGRDNRYGHPHEIVLERLKDSAVCRTDKNGTVTILTDGKEFAIQTDL